MPSASTDRLPSAAFVRRRLPGIVAAIILCALAIALLWAVVQSRLASEKADVMAAASREAFYQSRTYAQQVGRAVAQIDQIALSVRYFWRQSRGTFKLEHQRNEGLYPASAQLYVIIVDRDGNALTSTVDRPAQSFVNIATRDYFKQHQSGKASGLVISDPGWGRSLGKFVIRFTRSLEADDGSFDGIVVVAVEPAYLAAFSDRSALGRDDFVTVRKSNGTVLASMHGESSAGSQEPYRDVFEFPEGGGVRRFEADQFSDGRARLVGWQQVSQYPLVAEIGVGEAAALASFQLLARDYTRFAIAGTLILMLVAVGGVLVSIRLAWRKHQTDIIRDAYRLATEGGTEGFLRVRALYTSKGELDDFLFDDCNGRGAEFLGMTRDRLIGLKLSNMAWFRRKEDMQVLQRAMTDGSYQDEYQTRTVGPMRGKWIHRKLVRRGGGLAVTLRDISESKINEQNLLRMAGTDALTQLPNRHWLMEFLPGAIERALDSGNILALLFVDLDEFKNINDTMGHALGDELLQVIAQRLREVVRPQDKIVRLGGDEFTVVLEHVTGTSDVSMVAERVVQVLNEPVMLGGQSERTVAGSIGISLFPQDAGDAESLLRFADIAMYAAKARGKAQYQYYRPRLAEELLSRLSREQSLRRALEQDEFVVYYQPRVDTDSGELRGVEALVRWVQPGRGPIPPSDFIPLAEETGLIVKLGDLVTQKTCAQIADWQARQVPLVPISINVSGRQFSQGNVVQMFSACMAQHRIQASQIEIELTESCMIAGDLHVAEQLAAIKAMGIKLLVDDFGTGYSSLSQLQKLDMDGLKVDMSFTREVCNGPQGEGLFMAILSMAHVLDMSVVAEGVESAEQLAVLRELSCNEVQGYFISPPVSAAEMELLLHRRFLLPDLYAESAQELPW